MRTATLGAELTQVGSAVYDVESKGVIYQGDFIVVPGETYILKITIPYLSDVISLIQRAIDVDGASYLVGMIVNLFTSDISIIGNPWIAGDGVYVRCASRIDHLGSVSSLLGIISAVLGGIALLLNSEVVLAAASVMGLFSIIKHLQDKNTALSAQVLIERNPSGTPTTPHTPDVPEGPGTDMSWADYLLWQLTAGKVSKAPTAAGIATGILFITAAVLAFQYAMSSKK